MGSHVDPASREENRAGALGELSRSVLRLSWAMTVLGAQQAAEIARLGPPRSTTTAAGPVDVLSNAIGERFQGAFRGVYQVGTEWLSDLAGGRFRGPR
jgi:hypothetical protein